MTENTIQIPGTEIPKSGAALNVANQLYLDRSGIQDLSDITNGDWVRLAKGITDITPSAKEKSTATAYYDGGGYDTTEVTGKTIQLAVKGVRYFGDAGQDYVYSKTWSFGDAVKTRVLWINNGDPVMSDCTLTAITPTGGSADASQTFSLTIAFDGAPVTVQGELDMKEKDGDKGAYTATINAQGTNTLLTGGKEPNLSNTVNNGTGIKVPPSSGNTGSTGGPSLPPTTGGPSLPPALASLPPKTTDTKEKNN